MMMQGPAGDESYLYRNNQFGPAMSQPSGLLRLDKDDEGPDEEEEVSHPAQRLMRGTLTFGGHSKKGSDKGEDEDEQGIPL